MIQNTSSKTPSSVGRFLVDAADPSILVAKLQRDKQALRFRLSWEGPTGARWRHWYVKTKDEATAYRKLSELRTLGKIDPEGDLTALVRQHRVGLSPSKPTLMTWHAALEPWIESLDLSPNTEACHYAGVRRMIPDDAVFPGLDWFEAAAVCRTGPKKGQPLSPTTKRTRLRFLKSCARWHLGDQVPPEVLRVNVPRTRPEDHAHPLTRDEATRILGAIPAKYKPVFVALLEVGGRISEVLGLRWQDFNAALTEVTISSGLVRDTTRSSSARTLRTSKTKNGVVRTLPLSPAFTTYLRSRPDKEPASLVFHGPKKGNPVADSTLRAALNKAFAETGIPRRRLCETRHTRLSWVTEKGGLGAAQAWAGHRSQITTATYYARYTGSLTKFVEEL